eukprot:TRINITY_DN7414_c0_g1_i2.p1 TRINITY_DN7414_c0_g1~~TRINITY_DN7414_c0_g1_i2.p1  ORF type:complete len:174 (-),score=53.12 TRINITY_DN7414_c0_g1_i2:127-648(-)
MRVEKCFFCSGPLYPGHGVAFIRNDGKMFKFCRSKCHRHFKAKHNPRKMKWTKAYRKAHGKEMVVDTCFEFEKRRDEALRYNRNLVVATVQAMKRVAEIRERREKVFWENRMRKAKAVQKDAIMAEVEKNVHIVSEPRLKQKIQKNILEKERAEEEEEKQQAVSNGMNIEDDN